MSSPLHRAHRRRVRLEHAAVLTGGLTVYALASWALVAVAPGGVRAPLSGILGVGGAVVAMSMHLVHATGGTRYATEAERHSSKALRRIDGWRVIDAVPFGEINIDHVMVGPRGVVAVETTFLPVAAPVDDDGDDPFEHALRRARTGARRIRLLLKSVSIDARVAPALAVWGRGMVTVPFAAADGVAILSGREQRQWRSQLPSTGETLTDEQVERIAEALTGFVEGRREADRRRLSA